MLWEAAHRRLAQDSRDETARIYLGVRDGLLAEEVSIGRVTLRGAYQRPAYLLEDGESRPTRGLSGAELWDAVGAFRAHLSRPN